MIKKEKRGGARPGAGRPSGVTKEQLHISLPVGVIDEIGRKVAHDVAVKSVMRYHKKVTKK